MWDAAEAGVTGVISDAMKPKLEDNQVNFPSTQGFRALSTSKSLENFVLEAKVKGADLAKDIRDNPKLDGKQKLDQLAKLKSSKFYTPPTASLDKGTLTDEVELSMYMYLVMKSNSLSGSAAS